MVPLPINACSYTYIAEPPSEPRNLMITYTTSTTITLSWDPPESLGGRVDIVYTIWYQESVDGSSDRVLVGTLNTTEATITGAESLQGHILIHLNFNIMLMSPTPYKDNIIMTSSLTL